MTDNPETITNLPTKKPRTPAQIAAQFKPGSSGNPLGRALERKIDGIPISSYFNQNLGPKAAQLCNKVLENALAKDPKDIKPFEVDLAKWMSERVYGKAVDRVQIESTKVEPAYVTANLTIEQMEMIADSIVDADYQEADPEDDRIND